MVEQLTLNQLVVGSNPTRSTKHALGRVFLYKNFDKKTRRIASSGKSLEELSTKSVVVLQTQMSDEIFTSHVPQSVL